MAPRLASLQLPCSVAAFRLLLLFLPVASLFATNAFPAAAFVRLGPSQLSQSRTPLGTRSDPMRIIVRASDDTEAAGGERKAAAMADSTDGLGEANDNRRRDLLKGTTAAAAVAMSTATSPLPALASSSKSRTDGYEVQRTEREWAYVLSGPQYNILRQGGTERPYSSILEREERDGTYVCAGCGTPLFKGDAKFHSGTGWPSFASALPGVEVEDVNPVQANLAGAELRCKTCGGHLGDVFQDGFLFVNTPAFKSGKRFCIDGAALVFKPKGGGGDVFGDTPPPRKGGNLPDFLAPPKIQAR